MKKFKHWPLVFTALTEIFALFCFEGYKATHWLIFPFLVIAPLAVLVCGLATGWNVPKKDEKPCFRISFDPDDGTVCVSSPVFLSDEEREETRNWIGSVPPAVFEKLKVATKFATLIDP